MPNVAKILVEGVDGKKVWVTQKQFDVLNVLEAANGGGVAAVKGYVPTTNYTVCPVIDIQILTRFSYEKLLKRTVAAINSITFDDVKQHFAPKLAALSEADQRKFFAERISQELDSIAKTLGGDRSDANRQGHDRCYVTFASGISAHLETVKGADGLMHPVLSNGYPTVESIMVSHLELNRKYVKQGVKKVVNSGPSVLMKNAISKVMNSRSVGFRKLSLKADNFESMSISKNVIVPDDII